VGWVPWSGRNAGSPEVWVSRCRTVTVALPPAANSGTWRATGASSASRPASICWSTTSVVNSLEIDARSYSVSTRAGTRCSAGSATPTRSGAGPTAE
jgi:hypothetical protein